MPSYTASQKNQIAKTALEIGISKAAELYQVARKTVGLWVNELKSNGSKVRPPSRSVAKPATLAPEDAQCLQIVAVKKEHPDWSAAQIRSHLNLSCSLTTINKKIRRNNSSEAIPVVIDNECVDFELFFAPHKLTDQDEKYHLILLTADKGQICFAGLCREKTQLNLAIFCDYIFSRLREAAGNSRFQCRVLVRDGRMVATDAALTMIAAKNSLLLKEQPAGKTSVSVNALLKQFPDSGELYEINNLHAILISHCAGLNFHQQATTNAADKVKQTLWTLLQKSLPIDTDCFLSEFDYIKRETNFWQKYSKEFLIKSAATVELLVKQLEREFSKFNHQANVQLLECMSGILTVYPDKTLTARVNYLRGVLQLRNSRFKEAEQLFLQARKQGIQSSYYRIVIQCNSSLCNFYLRIADKNSATKYYHSQLSLAQKLGDNFALIGAHQGIAALYLKAYNFKAALGHYNKVLSIVEDTGNLEEKARTLSNIGVTYYNRGNLKKARYYYEEAIFLAERGMMTARLLFLYSNLALVFEDTGLLEEALANHLKACNLARQQNSGQLGVMILNLGSLYMTMGRFQDALICCNEVVEQTGRTGEKETQSIAIGNIGIVYYLLNKLDSAESQLKNAVKIAQKTESSSYLASYYYYLGEIRYKVGCYHQAAKHATDSLEHAARSERADMLFLSKLLKARIDYQLHKKKDGSFSEYFNYLKLQLQSENDKDNQSTLKHELFSLLKDSSVTAGNTDQLVTQYRQAALTSARERWQKTGNIIYRQRIEEIEKAM